MGERRAGGGGEESILAKVEVEVEGSGVGELSELEPHVKWPFATSRTAVSVRG